MALKIEELRVGNWIRQLHTGTQTQVSLFMLGEIADDETYLDHLFPIPLSGEVLEALGFTKTEYDAHKKNPIIAERLPEIAAKDYFDFKMSITEDGWQIRLEETDDWDVWYGKEESWTDSLPLVSIKSVHQLMNLYFSLTGKELVYGNKTH